MSKRQRKGAKLDNAPSNQLCWWCAHAVPDGVYGCSWSKNLEPVEGWTARPSSNGGVKTWSVEDCPQFLQDSKDTKRLADKKLKERIEAGRIEARPMTRRVGRHMEDTYFGENAVE